MNSILVPKIKKWIFLALIGALAYLAGFLIGQSYKKKAEVTQETSALFNK